MIHSKVNSLLPKIEEYHLAKLTNASVTDISETNLNGSILNNEVATEGYDIIRLDRGAVACFTKYCYSFNKYSHKINFVNHIDQIISEFNTLIPQECYLIASLNINLLFQGKEIFSNKFAKIAQKKMLPLLKHNL